MKKINKFVSILILLVVIIVTSCETTDLDLQANPNLLPRDQANLDNLMNTIQVDFGRTFTENIGRLGSQMVRIEQMRGRSYVNAVSPSNFLARSAWRSAYADILSDISIAEPIATSISFNKHLGIMKVLKANIYMKLVDFWGNVPFDEANNVDEFPFPNLNDGEYVYSQALALLDEAILLFEDGSGDDLEFEMYYNNDYTKWIKLANTLKMGAYVNTRLVDGNAINNFNAIVTAGNYITDNSEDFQYQYGTSDTSPTTRSQAYISDYTANGAGRYRSNWMMNLLKQNNDTRIKFYFKRQTGAIPGVDDSDKLPCLFQNAPIHYTSSDPFCIIEGGYWGRDHGNQQGIPPDGTDRTVVGVYPAGGEYERSASRVTLDDGAEGAGITPIMLNSWVDLMKAEMKLAQNLDATLDLQNAMQNSLNKVIAFGSIDPDFPASQIGTINTNATNFIANVITDYGIATSDEKWEILAKEHFTEHYGNGASSYNFYRRNGFPHDLQPNLEENPGNFVRSLFYPDIEANSNGNVSQKSNVDEQVFWDNNPASPTFPIAN